MDSERILIKKYENRRLYDATNSRYVNLEEVAQMVQQGRDVQVVDAASGEDITRVVLTQIIAEGAKTADSNFPLDILRQMVIASGRATQESAMHYTKAMIDLYQSTYRAMAPALNPFEFMQGGRPAGQPAETKAPAAAAAESGEEMAELKQRISDLERTLQTLASRDAKSGKAARKAPKPKPKPRAR